MKVLVIGSGGREHCLAWKIAQSPKVDEVISAPGNAGTAAVGRNVNIPVAAPFKEVLELAQKERVGLVVIGPEAPLVDGLADILRAAGIRVFGPSAAAACIEGSKIHANEIMERAGVPTAGAHLYESPKDAMIRLQHDPKLPFVIKVDGLAAGKGVSIHHDLASAEKRIDEIFVDKIFGEAGNKILIEDFLEGEEASVLAICNGEKFVTLLPAQDHKAVGEGDTGPNTGGMGSYCPAPLITADLRTEVEERVFKPTLEMLAKDGTPFTGCLYAGLMITADGPKVLEFNARFGDPETQCVLPLLKSDLVDLLLSASEGGDPGEVPLEWLTAADVGGEGGGPAHAMCVIAASGGYPGKYEKGKVISGLDDAAARAHVEVFHAGVAPDAEGRPVTSGGRVLGVTGLGGSLQKARDCAYAALGDIVFDGGFHRRDIGHRAGIKWE